MFENRSVSFFLCSRVVKLLDRIFKYMTEQWNSCNTLLGPNHLDLVAVIYRVDHKVVRLGANKKSTSTGASTGSLTLGTGWYPVISSAIIACWGSEFARYSMAVLAFFHPIWTCNCLHDAPELAAAVAVLRLKAWPVIQKICWKTWHVDHIQWSRQNSSNFV
jgi:hypothetical protein